MKRRTFIKIAASGTLAAGIGLPLFSHSKTGVRDKWGELLPLNDFGSTGKKVTMLGLGGFHIGRMSERDAQATIETAIAGGIRFFDAAYSYVGGQNERHYGKLLIPKYRDEIFLMTKTTARDGKRAQQELDESMSRMNTDYLDLYQVHNVRTNEDLDKAFGKDGAVKALEKLRDEGVIRFLGLTGHSNSGILLRGIREYPFDTLLMTLNAGDIHYDPFQEKLLKEAVKMEMGIIAMKVTATGRIFHKDGLTSMKQALGYVLSFPVSNAIISISEVDEVDENTRVAANFEPLGSVELKELEELVKPNKAEANYFKIHW